MPVTMEHIRGPRKYRHQISERKWAGKECDGAHGTWTRTSNENHVFLLSTYCLQPPPPLTHTKTPLDTVASIVKVQSRYLPHREKKTTRNEKKGMSPFSVWIRAIYSDPDRTSEKFKIRSGAYLTLYGISNKKFHTTSILFHVWSSIVARRLIVFDFEWLISFFFKKKRWSIIFSLISMQEIKMKKSNIKFHRKCFCENFVIPFYFGSRSKSGCRMHSGPCSGSAKARSSGPIGSGSTPLSPIQIYKLGWSPLPTTEKRLVLFHSHYMVVSPTLYYSRRDVLKPVLGFRTPNWRIRN